MKNLAIHLSPIGHGSIILDGQDISHAVRRLRLTSTAGEVPEVEIELAVPMETLQLTLDDARVTLREVAL